MCKTICRKTILMICLFAPLLMHAKNLSANPAEQTTLNTVVGKDPTRPLAFKAASHPQQQWQLSSLIVSATRKVAVINGQSVQEGQLLKDGAGVKVVKIKPQSVVLQQAEKTWELTMAPSVVSHR